MLQRNLCGEAVSALGFGMMRLPVCGEAANIDEAAARDIMDVLYEGGVTYADTAYSYHDGASEAFLGRMLPRYDRARLKIATKMPGHEVRPNFDARAIFETQLAKTGAGYFDYYLLHNVCEMSLPRYMDADANVLGYLLEQRRAGRIRHLGFSCHGQLPTLERFLEFCEDKAPGAVEFVQLQLNYVDWVLQDGAAKYALAQEAGLDVVVMEPLRGGALARVEGAAGQRVMEVAQVLGARSAAEVAFRWLVGLPGVKTVLSGMSTREQAEENVRIFAEAGKAEAAARTRAAGAAGADANAAGADVALSFGSPERAAVDALARVLADISPCTSCRYCTHECPLDLDIPLLLKLRDDARFQKSIIIGMQLDALPPAKHPEACLGCGRCAVACPQNIDIPALLADLAHTARAIPRWADISAARVAAEAAQTR